MKYSNIKIKILLSGITLLLIFGSCEKAVYNEVEQPDASFELFTEEENEDGDLIRVPVDNTNTLAPGQTLNIKFLGDADIFVYYLDKSDYTAAQKYDVTNEEVINQGVSSFFDSSLEEKITTAKYEEPGTYEFLVITTNYDYFGNIKQSTSSKQVVVME